MSKMNIVISNKTEKRFRDEVARCKGYKKGNISKAMEEAMELWIERHESAISPK